MTIQPGHRPQPTATQAGQPPIDLDQQRIDRIAEAFSAALDQATATPVRYDNPALPSHKDGAQIGTTPPVPQPGIPPQSNSAVDYAVRVLATGVTSVLVSAAGSGFLIATHYANPTTLGIAVAAPAVLAVPILALKGLFKGARQVVEAAPPVINQHYSGYIDQRSTHVHTKNNGVIAITRNELPPAN